MKPVQCVDYTQGTRYLMVNGDSAEVLAGIPGNSVGLGLTSIPFFNHYTYSASVRDAGNNDTPDQFFYQLGFITREMLRVTMPGRWFIIHVKDHIRYGSETGDIVDIMPLSDMTVAHGIENGWRYQGRITLSTDPVEENNATYRLSHGELKKDASKMSVGLPEYLLLFRKTPSDTSKAYSDVPVTSCSDPDTYPLWQWQVDANSQWNSNGKTLPWLDGGYDYQAHLAFLEDLERQGRLSRTHGQPIPSGNPFIWWNVRHVDVLNKHLNGERARTRGDKDETHICPFSNDVVQRVVTRWSNEGEVVLDPFAGIGTVPYWAIQMGRYGVGVELKSEYYETACRFLGDIEFQQSQPTLFDMEEMAAQEQTDGAGRVNRQHRNE